MKTRMLKLAACLAVPALLLVELNHQASGAAAPDYQPVDLTPQAFWPWINYRPSHEWTPPVEGRRTFNGVPFELAGVVQLTGASQARTGDFRVPVVTFDLDRRFTQVHLLHHGEFRGGNGTPIAEMVLHYEDDSEYVFVLRYGLHFQDWNAITPTPTSLGSTTRHAWVAPQLSNLGSGQYSGLWQTAVPNPHPGKTVKRITFRSVFGPSSYTLDAVTLEQGEPLPELDESKLLGRSLPAPAVIERKVRFVDQSDGRPVAGGRVNAWLKAGQAGSAWGVYDTDAQGQVTIRYPANQNVPLELAVVGRDHLPTWCSLAALAPGEMASPVVTEFKLARGKVIGGRIVDDAGKPIAGVRVAISAPMSVQGMGFTLCQWPVVHTDAQGRWSIGAAPDDFKNLTLQISHDVHLPASYEQDESGDAFTIAAVDLLKREAAMEMTPGQTLAGRVIDGQGKPVPGARITYFLSGDHRAPKQRTVSGADGTFAIKNLLPGEGVAVATASGHAPALFKSQLEPGGQPWELKLEPARPLEISVSDAGGKAVPFAHVMLIEWRDGLWVDWLEQSGMDGKVSWGSAPADEARYVVMATDLVEQVVTLKADDGPHKITLEGLPRVRLKVVDAATGQPIDAFTVIKGQKYTESHTQWEDFNPLPGRAGEFQMELDRLQRTPYGFALQVQAPGYHPGVSETFRAQTNLLVKLERGVPPRGVVVDAAGRPVSGVQLVVASEQGNAYMDQPPMFHATGRNSASTNNADGTFELPIMVGALGVYAAHEKGFGSITFDELKQSGKLALKPWARVEGFLKVGERVTDEQTVSLHRTQHGFYDPKDMSARFSLFAKVKPGADGRFVFSHVPPMEVELSLEYPPLMNREIQWSHQVPLTLAPGQVTNVVIGGTGRPVVGRVRLAEELRAEAVLTNDVHKLMRVPSVRRPEFRQPAGARTQEAMQAAIDVYNQRMREFWASDDGRRFKAEQRSYLIRFDGEGGFRCDNVPPGEYNLMINLTKAGAQEWQREPVASHIRPLKIEPGDTPIDLGEISLRRQMQVRPGAEAPELPMRTLEGKPLKLADLRGRMVLLVFWSPGQPDSDEQVKLLKDLHQRTKDSGKLTLVTVTADMDPAKLKALATEHGQPWLHTLVDRQEAEEVINAYLNSRPYVGFGQMEPAPAHLIGPDGNIMSPGASLGQVMGFIDQLVSQGR